MKYEYNPCESLTSFIDNDFTENAVMQLIKAVGYNTFSRILGPCTGIHAVLIEQTANYSFTNVELEWVQAASSIIAFKVNDYSLFFIDMGCNTEEYYISCAAIIKIIDRAFNLNCLYIFKIGKSIAFGSLLDINRAIPNNFVISKLINENNYEFFFELIEEIFIEEMENLPFLISDFSPLASKRIDDPSDYYSETVYDQSEYLTALLEIQSIYGLDTAKERERVTEHNENKEPITLIDCSELSNVANDASNPDTYKELLLSSALHENEEENKYDEIQLSFFDDDLPIVSDEAYENAEQMLKELLGNKEGGLL